MEGHDIKTLREWQNSLLLTVPYERKVPLRVTQRITQKASCQQAEMIGGRLYMAQGVELV